MVIDLQLKVAALNNEFTTFTTQMSSMSQTINSLEAELSTNTSAVDDLQNVTTRLSSSVQSVLDAMDITNNNLSILEQNYITLIAQLQSIQQDISTISNSTTANSSSINTLINTVTALQTTMSTLELSVSNLSTSVSNVQNSVSSMQTSITNIQTSITQIQNKIKIPSVASNAIIQYSTYCVIVADSTITTLSGYFTLKYSGVVLLPSLPVRLRDAARVEKPIVYRGNPVTWGTLWVGPMLLYNDDNAFYMI